MVASHLVPKIIFDKNGKRTTVMVRAEQHTKSSKKRISVIANTKNLNVLINPPAEADRDPNSPYAKSWNKIPLRHVEIKTPNGSTWDLAPEGYSGAYCDTCGSYFKDSEINDSSIQCSLCMRTTRGGRIASGIRYSDVQFFDDETVRNSDWYHISTRADWETDIRTGKVSEQPFIHVGSYEAAERRMNDIIKDAEHQERLRKAGIFKPSHTENDEQLERFTSPEDLVFYCYKIKLTDDAVLSPNILTDYDSDAPSSPAEMRESIKNNPEIYSEFYSSYEILGATRYVNEYESHGSISLIAHPIAISITERIKLG